jgi:serine/threonine protein kinase
MIIERIKYTPFCPISFANHKVVARKVLRLTKDTNEKINREAQIMVELCEKRHPNIVQVYSHGRVTAFPYYYIDMELCNLDLSEYIERMRSNKGKCPLFCTKLSPEERMCNTFNIFNDITSGIAFIHQHGKVHRDIKPQNSKLLFFRP